MTAVLPKLRAQAIANDGERNVAVIGGGRPAWRRRSS